MHVKSFRNAQFLCYIANQSSRSEAAGRVQTTSSNVVAAVRKRRSSSLPCIPRVTPRSFARDWVLPDQASEKRPRFSGLRASGRASAVALAEKYQDGWQDSWNPGVGIMIFELFDGDRHVGGYGISSDFIAEGTLNRKVPEAEITALAKLLGLPWSS
jgi:hypothetical protein